MGGNLELTEQDGFFKSLLDNMQIGIIVSDAEGFLIYINRTYARFLNVSIQDSIGRHATDVISNTRLHIVGKTGQAEINHPHWHRGVGFLVHRIPIKDDTGSVIAVLGLVLFDSATTAVDLAQKVSYLESRLESYQAELASLHKTQYTFDQIVGLSDAMQNAKEEAVRAATNDLPVLITGASGTGKELFAQAIHQRSARRAYPFVRVNCAAIPRELLESELFGYDKGSFTGASRKGKPGKFELANMGTIFLDEIGDMSLDMQPKLLRVLELKEFERVGGTTVLKSDFRLIAATNQDLDELIRSGQFRRDLYYRLNVIPVEIPPLRDRSDDVVPMAYHFIQKIVKGPRGKGIRISPKVIPILQSYPWPGNGRELLHTLERILSSSDRHTIRISDLPPYMQSCTRMPRRNQESSLSEYLQAAEKYAIEEALVEADGVKSKAAEILGIHRTQLYRKMKKLTIGEP